MKKILLISTFALAASALAVKAAYITRGYFGVGGEWLIWIFPILIIAARYEDGKEEVRSVSSSKTTKGQAQEEKTEWI